MGIYFGTSKTGDPVACDNATYFTKATTVGLACLEMLEWKFGVAAPQARAVTFEGNCGGATVTIERNQFNLPHLFDNWGYKIQLEGKGKEHSQEILIHVTSEGKMVYRNSIDGKDIHTPGQAPLGEVRAMLTRILDSFQERVPIMPPLPQEETGEAGTPQPA